MSRGEKGIMGEMRVALVHDYLTEFGGAERTLQAMHEIWPGAPIYTGMVGGSGRIGEIRGARGVNWLGKAATFFMPFVFEGFDLRGFDVVISDGTIWSKSVLTTPEQLHIFYCHTPPRFLYGYPGETDRRRLWYLAPILKPLDHLLRIWDFASAQRPDYIIANSQTTAARIKKFWRREAKVIYPPVGKGERGEPGRRGKYFLVVSRLSAYKNVDLAIKVCNRLNLPLKIVGVGREESRLRRVAGPTVEFCGFVNDADLAGYYQNCRALICPVSNEDFGIVPVEAMSFGKPVVALRSGGVTETVVEGKTGVFFEEPTVESLAEAIQQFNNLTIRPEACVERAAKFSKERFQREFKQFVEGKCRGKISN